MLKYISILFTLISLTIFASPYPTEYVDAEFAPVSVIQPPEPIAPGLTFEGAVSTEPTLANLDDLTGFALLLNGDLPGESRILAEIFWSDDGEKWNGPLREWEIEHNDDEGPVDDRIYSNPYYTSRSPAKYYRANFYLYSDGDDTPRIDRVRFVFMDCGWTESEPVPVTIFSPTDWPMPSYVSRGPSGWDCPIPDTFASGTPTYYTTITHVTIHHTAGATSTPSDPCAQMRNIWNYHVYTRGWNDIGYNFVLDHLGNIYHGRYSADLANLDVRAAHCSYHNANVMGFSVMGNFETDYIHEPTWPAIYDLITWKCDQRGIDPYGSAWNGDPGYEDYALCILGHKDWESASTACPGAHFHPEIPMIRDTVYLRLTGGGGTGDSIIVDNGDPGFTDSGSWITGTYAPELGWWNDYQYCDAGGDDDWAVWTPTIPDDGQYDVYMWWLAGSNRCDSVFVRMFGMENESLFVSQKGSGASWHYLGRMDMLAGTDGYVSIADRTATDGSVVIADAVLWLYYDALDVPETPAKPDQITLHAYPNPFNTAVTISVEQTFLSVQNDPSQTGMSGLPIQIEIYDVNGRLVSVLENNHQPVISRSDSDEKSRAVQEEISRQARNDNGGRNRNDSVGNVRNDSQNKFVWQPSPSITSGIYLVRANIGDESVTKRLVYLK